MVASWKTWAPALLFLLGASAFVDPDTSRLLLNSGPKRINEWIAINQGKLQTNQVTRRDTSNIAGPGKGKMTDNPPYDGTTRAYCFGQPRSHFDSSQSQQFCQRYWVDASNYKPGGPVILFDTGEEAGDYYIDYEYAWTDWNRDEWHGVYIVLEHRQYGWSFFSDTMSTDDMRFLNHKESLQDSVEFMRNWTPPANLTGLAGIDPATLKPGKSPWLYWGGSYPGGRAAHMRVLHPDLVYGAVSSSGVTVAKIDYWEYWNGIVNYGPSACTAAIESAIIALDKIIDVGGAAATQIKTLFGLQELLNDDFANTLTYPLGDFQYAPSGSYKGDPRASSPGYYANAFIDDFCPALVAARNSTNTTVIGGITVPASLLNYADYMYAYTQSCRDSDMISYCYGSTDDSLYQDTGTDSTWRSWTWQTCTEWGYAMPAPPPGKKSVVSKYLTLDYTLKICKQAFPPGKVYQVPAQANVNAVNQYGGYSIAADRLALIGGQMDPYRSVTPLADGQPTRPNTLIRPAYVTPNGSHCPDFAGTWDTRSYIQDVEAVEHKAVSYWLSLWNSGANRRGRGDEKRRMPGSR